MIFLLLTNIKLNFKVCSVQKFRGTSMYPISSYNRNFKEMNNAVDT